MRSSTSPAPLPLKGRRWLEQLLVAPSWLRTHNMVSSLGCGHGDQWESHALDPAAFRRRGPCGRRWDADDPWLIVRGEDAIEFASRRVIPTDEHDATSPSVPKVEPTPHDAIAI
jgi:hypothetical protein